MHHPEVCCECPCPACLMCTCCTVAMLRDRLKLRLQLQDDVFNENTISTIGIDFVGNLTLGP